MAIVLIIALVIFGPKRLPELGRSLGNGLREFKSSVSGEDRDKGESATIEHEPDVTTAYEEDAEAVHAASADDRTAS